MTDDDVNVEATLASALLDRITTAVDDRAASLEVRLAAMQHELNGMVPRLRKLEQEIGKFFLPKVEGAFSFTLHHENGLSTKFVRQTYRRDEA